MNSRLFNIGVESFANGMEYRGEFIMDKREGFGVVDYLDGSKYMG